MRKPLISICVSSIRSELWETLYNSFNREYKNVSIEFVMVGPVESDRENPSNSKYIKTENVKPTQCFEISMREAQGDFIMMIGDDHIIRKSLDDFYAEYNEVANRSGNDKFFILPHFKFGNTIHSTPYHRKARAVNPASTLGAMINRKWIEKIGGFDRRFIGIYMDIDFVMRFHQYGGRVLRTSQEDLIIEENSKYNKMKDRLTGKLGMFDRAVLDSFWVRDAEEGEKVPSDTTWCYYRGKDRVLSKYRTKEFEPFDDKDIKLFSQGTTEHLKYGWV